MIYLILILALVARLVLINQSFWLDEAASLKLAQLPLKDLLPAIGNDFHPPLYYFLLHFWLQLGLNSEWFLRLPGVIFGTLTVYYIYLLFNQLSKNKKLKLIENWSLKIGILPALLLAFNPLHIYYSQELRMYSLTALLTTISWYLLLRLTKNSKSIENWSLKIGLLTVSIANTYVFYLAFFNLLAQLLYVYLYHKKYFRRLILLSLISLLFFLPWLSILQQQLAGGQLLQRLLPGWAALSGDLNLKSLLLIPLKFSLGRLNLSTSKLYLLTAASSAVYFFSLIFLGIRQKVSRPFLIWLLTPLTLAFFISLQTPILGYWRYIFILPAFTSLVAIGISVLPRRLRLLNLGVVIITLLLANILFYLSPASQREDWRAAAAFALEFDQTTTISLFAFSDAFAPIRWYAPDLHYAAPLKNFSADPEKLDLSLSQATLNAQTVLYFNYLSPLTDPSGNIFTWLNNAGFKLEATKNFSGVGFIYVYSAPNDQ